jgi:hypothetical protein
VRECRSIAMPVTVTVNVNAFGLGRQFGLELFDYLFFFSESLQWGVVGNGKGNWLKLMLNMRLSCLWFLSFLLAVDSY